MSKMTVKVGIADLNVVKSPGSLITYALGSCVGICLYYEPLKIAGMAHVMLPTALEAMADKAMTQPFRYADTAVPILIKKMEHLGASRTHLKAKIAGGAKMFGEIGGTSISNIGMRNIISVKAALNYTKIPIIAEDTGKNYGRTLFFDASDGIMIVKSAVQGEVRL